MRPCSPENGSLSSQNGMNWVRRPGVQTSTTTKYNANQENKMKIRALIAGTVGLVSLASTGVPAADTTLFIAKSGGKLRIEGTSSFHDWQAETPFISGSLEVGSDFPKESGQAV